jgi:hypothetical protein
MRAYDLHERRLPFGALLVSVVAGANAASVIATLLGFSQSDHSGFLRRNPE